MVPEDSEVFRKKYAGGTEQVCKRYAALATHIKVDDLTREHLYSRRRWSS